MRSCRGDGDVVEVSRSGGGSSRKRREWGKGEAGQSAVVEVAVRSD